MVRLERSGLAAVAANSAELLDQVQPLSRSEMAFGLSPARAIAMIFGP